jgi:curved DNA-binding protein CbpA
MILLNWIFCQNEVEILDKDFSFYRKLLRLNENFTQNELKTAYRQYAMKYHPDKYVNMPESQEQHSIDIMKQINDAYEYLKAHTGKDNEGSNIYMPNELWDKIIKDITTHPRDLQTIPLIRRVGVWFHVSINIDRVTICVNEARAKEHKQNSSKLLQTRVLDKGEFQTMYPIYLLRKRGKKVAKDAAAKTRNQVYIYSIFKNCGEI